MTGKKLMMLVAASLLACVGAGIGVSFAVRGTASPLTVVSSAAAIVAATVIMVAYVRQEYSNSRIAQLAKDMRTLAELTQGSIEEARAQKPEPGVSFMTADGPTDSLVWTRVIDQSPIDRAAILSSQRDLALATLPLPKVEDHGSQGGTLLGLIASIQTASAFLEPPITQQDRDSFIAEVEGHLQRLAEWLVAYETWRSVRPLILEAYFEFHNLGRVPATDVHVTMTLPDGVERLEKRLVVMSPPSRYPEFQPPKSIFESLQAGSLAPVVAPMLFPGASARPSVPPNLEGPTSKGSQRVEFTIGKLLHGVPEESNGPVFIRIPDDRTYEVAWELSAGNLSSPANGKIILNVKTERPSGGVIATLDDLVQRNRLKFRRSRFTAADE